MSLVIQEEITNIVASPELKDFMRRAYDYSQKSKSANTNRAYRSHWKYFEAWCDSHGLRPLPTSSEAIALYLGSLGGKASNSKIDGVIAAIESKHREMHASISGNQDLYKSVRKGIRNEHPEKQTKKKAKPITTLDLKVACCKLDGTIQSCRDRAIITLLYFGALRRSELVALDVEHIDFQEKGIVISIMQSKTSDTCETIYLAYAKDTDICPVTNLRKWLTAASIDKGAIFRSFQKGGKIAERLSGHAINDIVKERLGEKYSGHSGRRGILTEAAAKGTSIHIMQKHSRHKDIRNLGGYIDAASGFENSSVAVLGV
ncbi:MAG: tyrosine-type recombinase/integrase [Verrucomicrobia bacterium]|nr:tyrosine-type recombinase/integrase [Verrucomicrobiota bacterium]